MKYCKVENGIVVQTQPSKDEDFIKCPNSVSCGMLFDGAEFTNPPPPSPPPPLTVTEKQAAIDKFLDRNEPLKFILEAIEDANGMNKGALTALAKTKVT